MKFLFLLIFVLPSFLFGQTTLKVAFLGNSYTSSNSLIGLIDSLANADGNDMIHDQNTPGGYTLNGHSTNTVSLNLITSNSWDFVVLQDQSQYPSFPYSQVITDVYPKAKILCDSIRSANECAIPIFFNTWGRLNGDQQWDSIDTFEKMNNRLYLAYNHMANTNNGIVSPVGFAFKTIYDDANAIVSHSDLYSSDGSHPSIFGSYLAACIFYNTLFSTNAQGNSYFPTGITQAQCNYLQQIASNVIYMASSPIFDYTHPIALFDFSITGTQVVFNNMSQHAYAYSWEFGEGNTSQNLNPVHDYSEPGTYVVKLIATYCGRTMSYQQTIVIAPLGVSKQSKSLLVYPIPTTNYITIEIEQPSDIELINLEGKIVYQKSISPSINIVDLSNQPVGLYFLKITTKNDVRIKKVIKK